MKSTANRVVPLYDPAQPVPDGQRLFTRRDAFALWFSLGLGLLTAQTGALMVPGLSLPQALLAILCGTLAGATLLAAAGTIGSDTGLAAMSSLRATLGEHGALLPTLVNVVQLIGWGSFEVVIMRDAFDALSRQSIGFSWPLLWGLLAGGVATWVAVLGPLSFVRRFLRNWGIWLLLAAASWLSYNLLAHQQLAHLWQQPGDGSISFSTGIDLAIANALSWLPLISDYTRFGRKPGQMFSGTLCGFAIGNLCFYTLGAIYGLAAGPHAMLVSSLASAGGGVALLLILLGEIDNAFADIHSAAVSCGLIAKGCSVRLLALAIGLLCMAIGLGTPLAQFQSFLIMIGSIFAPLFGVVLTDHFLIRRRAPPNGNTARRWRGDALVAWLIGIACYQLIYRCHTSFGASLPALSVSALCYWSAARIAARAPTGANNRAPLP